MKTLLLIFAGILIAGISMAQTTAVQYMKQVPKIPDSVCLCNEQVKTMFENSVRTLKETISNDAEERNRRIEKLMQSMEGDMMTNMAKNSGLTDEEMKKLQSGEELTQAEQDAMINRVMMQKSNVSLDEAKNMKNMTKEGQQAWAEGYAAEQQAVIQSSPQQSNTGNDNAMNNYTMIAEQTALRNKLSSMEQTLSMKYVSIENDAAAEEAVMDKELKPLYEELHSINDGEGSTQADIDHASRVIKKIEARQDKYCAKYTPRMVEFLKECKSTVENSFADYDRAEELQYLVSAAQTSTDLPTKSTGTYSIQAVNLYLGYLVNVFKYSLH